MDEVKIGYKKLQSNLVATLQITGQTNEHRTKKNLYPAHAKHRTNAATVISIEHAVTGERFTTGVSIYDKTFEYHVGNSLHVECTLDSVVCAPGIHYFQTKETAVAWEMDYKSFSGSMTQWHENGAVREKGTYVNGVKHGIYRVWSKRDVLRVECTFKHGSYDGLYLSWHANGSKWE